ncbi:MAG: pre-peptidase C-terminal domain-containing protein [Pirellulales bacterium]
MNASRGALSSGFRLAFRGVLGVLVASAAGTALAQAPAVSSITPWAVPPGGSADLTIAGGNLQDATGVWTNLACSVDLAPGVENNGKTPERVVYRVTAPSEAAVGIYGLRVATQRGISPLRLFMVDDLPSIAENGQNHSPETAQQAPIPVAIDGACDPQAMDYYKFDARAGQKLTLEAVARRLGSKLDPMLRVLGPEGRELAYSDDEEGLGADGRVRLTIPADGTYLVEIRDIRYDGGGEHRYRLRIGDYPLVSVPYPLAVRAGTKGAVEFCGNVADELAFETKSIVAPAAGGLLPVSLRWPQGQGSAFTTLEISDLPECLEFEPNDTPETAVAIAAPSAVNGRFDKPRDRDQYRFDAKAGQRFRFTAHTRRLGSPSDLYLRVYNSEGGQLAEADDSGRDDVVLDFTAPADGQFRLAVEDLNRRGGPQHAYRLECVAYEPGFTLSVEAEKFDVPHAGVLAAKVTSGRRDYNGPIALAIEGLPEGSKVDGATIAEGQNEANLRVTLPASAAAGTFAALRIVGTAKVGEQTLSAVATAEDALRDPLGGQPFPPADLSRAIGLGIGGDFPPFLKLSVDGDAAVLPQLAGGANLVVKLERSNGFDGDVPLAVSLLPSGVSLEAKPIEKGKNEVTLAIKAPEGLAPGEYRAQLTATATHQNQPGKAELSVPLRIVAPATAAIAPAGALPAGGTQKVKITLTRLGEGHGPAKIEWRGLPPGVTAPETELPADKPEVEVEFAAAADAPKGTYAIRAVVHYQVRGRMLTAATPEVALEIAGQ